MANSKQFLFDDKEHRRLKTGTNISTVLDSEGDVIIDLPNNITSNAATATLAEKIQFQNNTSKSYLLGSPSTTSGQKPTINNSVYMSDGNLYATGFYGNGAGLTKLTAANIQAGTAPINITGTAGKVGFTIDSSRKTYLLGTTTTVADSSTTGEIKPTYSSYIYMQNNTLYAGYFSGNGMYLSNVTAINCTGNSATATRANSAGQADTANSATTASTSDTAKMLKGGDWIDLGTVGTGGVSYNIYVGGVYLARFGNANSNCSRWDTAIGYIGIGSSDDKPSYFVSSGATITWNRYKIYASKTVYGFRMKRIM